MKSTSILLASVVAVFALLSSCKKKNDLDPTINSRTVNKTITPITIGSTKQISDYLDLDNDGKIDINFVGNLTDSVKGVQIEEANDSTKILSNIESVPPLTVGAVKPLSANTWIDVSSSYWTGLSMLSYINIKKTKERTFGIQGIGDVYVGFKINKPDDNNYYGWMLINVSADLNTIVVKEVAVNKILNEGILAGEI